MQDRVSDSPRFLIHDRDTKFTKQFDGIFTSSGVKVVKLPIHSPNLNAHCERVNQSIKHEGLGHFIVFGEHHLNHLVQEYARYYHKLRPHQGINNRLPLGPLPLTDQPPKPDQLIRQHQLGGLLKHYALNAAGGQTQCNRLDPSNAGNTMKVCADVGNSTLQWDARPSSTHFQIASTTFSMLVRHPKDFESCRSNLGQSFYTTTVW